MIIKVSASEYLPYLPFGAIGKLGLHDAGFILELQLQPHWLALELFVGEGLGAENLSHLQFGMWLVAFPDQGDHDSPLPILTGRLMRLLEFCDGFRG